MRLATSASRVSFLRTPLSSGCQLKEVCVNIRGRSWNIIVSLWVVGVRTCYSSVLAESLARIFLFARASEDSMVCVWLTGHSVALVAVLSEESDLPRCEGRALIWIVQAAGVCGRSEGRLIRTGSVRYDISRLPDWLLLFSLVLLQTCPSSISPSVDCRCYRNRARYI